MMDFPRKEKIMEMIARNGTLSQKLAQLGQLALDLAANFAPEMMQTVAQIIGLEQNATPTAQGGEMPQVDATGGLKPQEHAFVDRSRRQTQESTQPNA